LNVTYFARTNQELLLFRILFKMENYIEKAQITLS